MVAEPWTLPDPRSPTCESSAESLLEIDCGGPGGVCESYRSIVECGGLKQP